MKFLKKISKAEWIVFLAFYIVHPVIALVYLGFIIWTMEE